LRALRDQTLSFDQWELLIIDNHSAVPLAPSVNLSWHPSARIVRENELGLTAARLRGIHESRTDFLVFVDDDNVLDSQYLAISLRLAEEWPRLGSFGAGKIEPEFEIQPPAAMKPYYAWLTLRDVDDERWSNNPGDGYCVPWGAGLCVRRCLAMRYVEFCRSNPLAIYLDRRGTDLLGGGDIVLATSGHGIGIGWGIFPSLKVRHLIPALRLRGDYIVKIAERMAISGSIVFYLTNGGTLQKPNSIARIARFVYHNVRLTLAGDAMGRAVRNASDRGTKEAFRMLAAHGKEQL